LLSNTKVLRGNQNSLFLEKMKSSSTTRKGQVITFYSYKGGTGRSMALANAACLLTRDGHKVLMIDWDMEAPGLPKYFRPFLPSKNHNHGLIDFIEMADAALPPMEYDAEDELALKKVFEKTGDYLTPVLNSPDAKGKLFLLKSGDEHSENYPSQISHFDWEKFFYKIRGFFKLLARYLAQEFDYVLIDSRTGHTDTGGICTMMMPEKLVLVFTPNQQSYDGIAKLARKATGYRRRSDDLRPLMIYPLPSRIDLGEEDLRQAFLEKYRDDFTALLQEIYDVSEVNFDRYLNNIQIRHSSKFAYQERLAILEEKIWDKDSLSQVYRNFTDLLKSKEMFWRFPFKASENPNAVKVFIAYSRADRNFKNELERHLAILKSTQKISIWSDSDIQAGEIWDKSIRENLNNSDLILLLISPDFFNSDYIREIEINTAFKRMKQGECRILPIIIRPVAWQEDKVLSKIQVSPKGGKPIETWSNRDAAWAETVQDIRRIVDEIEAQKKTRQHKSKVPVPAKVATRL